MPQAACINIARPAGGTLAAFLLGACLLAPLPALGGSESTTGATVPAQAPATTIAYVPPSRGAPGGRISGASRYLADSTGTIELLAPDDLAWSATDKPTFYWRSQAQGMRHLLFRLVEAASGAEIVRAPVDGSAELGQISLAALDVRLSPREEYRWSLAPIAAKDPAVEAGRLVRYVPLAPEAATALSGLDPVNKARRLAEFGYWHDALHALSAAATGLADATAERLRGDLLAQIGLGIGDPPAAAPDAAAPDAAPPGEQPSRLRRWLDKRIPFFDSSK